MKPKLKYQQPSQPLFAGKYKDELDYIKDHLVMPDIIDKKERCIGDECGVTLREYMGNLNNQIRHDSWFLESQAEKEGVKPTWSLKQERNTSNLKELDVPRYFNLSEFEDPNYVAKKFPVTAKLVMNRKGLSSKAKKDKYGLETTGHEHQGIISGYKIIHNPETGNDAYVPIITHGGSNSRVHQLITELDLHPMNSPYSYTATAVIPMKGGYENMVMGKRGRAELYRPLNINKDRTVKPYPKEERTEVTDKIEKALNDKNFMKEAMLEYNLSEDEYYKLAELTKGIAEQETRTGKSTGYGGRIFYEYIGEPYNIDLWAQEYNEPREMASEIAHLMFGKDPASRGIYKIKDTLFYNRDQSPSRLANRLSRANIHYLSPSDVRDVENATKITLYSIANTVKDIEKRNKEIDEFNSRYRAVASHNAPSQGFVNLGDISQRFAFIYPNKVYKQSDEEMYNYIKDNMSLQYDEDLSNAQKEQILDRYYTPKSFEEFKQKIDEIVKGRQ